MNQDKNKQFFEEISAHIPKGYMSEHEHIPVKGKGSRYTDKNGKVYLDCSSGIFTNSFGHAFPPFVKVAYNQSKKLSNVHGRRTDAELIFFKRLVRYMPASNYKFIPYNDGGYAIDRALTDIINYFDKNRIPIAAYRGGFHGKTMAAKLTVNDSAQATFFENFQLDYPYCYRCPLEKEYPSCQIACADESCKILKERKAKAIIFELIQGSAIVIPPNEYWKKIAKFCREESIVMLADEVLTGGGRTGEFLASSLYGIVPDIIAITKGLANGNPLSVICEQEYITDNIYAQRPSERSSTFAAHPEALAIAAELLNQLEIRNIFQNVLCMSDIFAEGLLEMKLSHPSIGDVRCIGLMAAIEFVKNKNTKEPFYDMGEITFQKCRANGLETIFSGHIIRLAPPLNISRVDLKYCLNLLEKSICQAEECCL